MYGSEDPFENGWASANNNNQFSAAPYGSTSTYLTSLQLLQTTPESDISGKAPESYRAIFDKLPTLSSVNELELLVFAPLVENSYFSLHQVSRIIDTLYDHNLLPASTEKNFFQILGLVALELDVAGSGDFVTLQFRLNSSLPPLPPPVVTLLLSEKPEKTPEIDPLTILATTEENAAEWTGPDAMLADHSALSIDPDATMPQSIHVNDFPYISKYVAEIREKFKPLVGKGDLIRIKEVPEKEGLVFKHTNYAVTHDLFLGMNGPSGTKKVVRRYSDFVWLLEFLLKKYPFRVIPGLPPKKFTGM